MNEETDVRRVRIGMAVLALVVIVCLVVARRVDATGPRFLLGAIALFTLVRLFVLMRSVRRSR